MSFWLICYLFTKQNHAILSMHWILALHSFNCFNTLSFKTSFIAGWPILLFIVYLYVFHLFLINPFKFLFQYFLKNNCVLLFQLLFSFCLLLSIVLALLFYTLFNKNVLILYNFYYSVCVYTTECGGERTSCRNRLCPFVMCTWGSN